jgi:hypothetical protein
MTSGCVVDNEVGNGEDEKVIMGTQTPGGKACVTELGN